MHTDPKPIAVTVKAACRMGGFGLTKAYELIESGELASLKIGRRRLIRVDSLERLLAVPAETPPDHGAHR
jgi:excisionase family DNA binding protein